MNLRGAFYNSGKLLKFMLRRERINSTLWLVILILFSVALASAMADMFDPAARQALAETLQNPAMIAMMGPVFGAENYTAGAMYSGSMFLWVAIAVAVMNILLVVRHTRADEEKGRAEVIRSLPVGRMATLHSAMILALIVNVILAVFTGFGIAVLGVESMGFSGSILYGAALGVVGLFFAALAALFSQLCASSRGALGYSGATLGLFYFMRAAGDVGNETLSLISPLGLAQRAQIYVENHWWPIAILLAASAIVAVVAYRLNALRDIDQGFIAARPGPRDGRLKTPFGFSYRLLRNSLITWFIIMLLLGASYGSLLGDIETFVAESEFYQRVIGANDQFTTAEMFVTMVNSMAALTCLVPILMAALKLRTEEREGRSEHILTRSVCRIKYLASFAVPAFVMSALFQLATAIGLYISAAAVLDEPVAFAFLARANLVYLPALWVTLGIAVFLIGALPRASGAVWAYFGFSFFTAFMGRMLNLPEWLGRLSPFGYIPQLPIDEVRLGVLLTLVAVAAALTALGFVFYKRRDVAF
ncbi:MAG: ABC transporter permease [Oscillospiraceae bacterium]|nr:ABC transporter permease [Oscillospiraceae bacterium]